MKKLIKCAFSILSILILSCTVLMGQNEQLASEYQAELDEFYKNPEESPLREKAIDFKGLSFFPIDTMYRVKAKFIRSLNSIPFHMKTTGSRLPVYEKYGEAHFTIHGKLMVLNLYQSQSLRDSEDYEDQLFLPFTDNSNGEESYTGGRFIDLQIPKDDFIIIDFNKAYNPYCAYAEGYSCTIPPAENDLDIKILAGVRYDLK